MNIKMNGKCKITKNLCKIRVLHMVNLYTLILFTVPIYTDKANYRLYFVQKNKKLMFQKQ